MKNIVRDKKLLLVDGHSLIHRAYHAFPATLSTASGEQTNAVYGFTRMLLEAIHDLRPTHVAIAFDLPGPTFRETMFVGYKRSRVKPDDAMIVQIPRVKEVVHTLGIPIFEVPGFEADDVIGTLCRQATEKMINRQIDKRINRSIDQLSNNPLVHSSIYPLVSVTILTSDRDLMQLIRGSEVRVKMPERGRNRKRTVLAESRGPSFPDDLWNEQRFVVSWGFKPELLSDYKAFAGDASDDIPGVRGIGEKTAKELVGRFGSVDDVYREVLKGRSLSTQGSSLMKKLVEDQEAAQMSKKLATIDTGVPIKLEWGAMEVHGYDKEKAIRLFDELQFKSLVDKLPNDSFEERVQEVLF